MGRSIDTGTLSTFQDDQSLHMFHLITIEFSTVQRLTDSIHDINYDFGSGTETFTSTGRLTSLDEVPERMGINNQSISITITGASASDISLMLNENYTNTGVTIRRGFYNSSGATTDSDIVGKPFILFQGNINTWTFNDNPQSGDSTISYELTSHWADWERVSGRKSNNENAQVWVAADESYSYVFDRIGDRVWGKVQS